MYDNIKGVTVDLYIRSKPTPDYVAPNTQACWSNGANTGRFPIMVSMEHALTNKESNLKEVLKAMALEYRFELEVHDLALKTERKNALFKFILKTPVIMVGGYKIKNPPSDKESLLSLLEEAVT